jgi:DNA-binding protein H-NS
MSIDLAGLSPQQLDELIMHAEETKRRLHRERISEVRRKLTQMAKDEGYSIDELFGSGGRRGGTKVSGVPKFANPGDSSQTWSGRGKRPGWFKDALVKGVSADSMRVG